MQNIPPPPPGFQIDAPAPMGGRPVYQELPPQAPPVRPVTEQRDQVGLQRDQVELEKQRIELERTKAGTDAKKAGVEQGKAAGFYQRAVKSNSYFNNTGVGAPSLVREGAQAVLPEGAVNALTDPARQQAEAAQRDFVAATLRYESGAAIPPQELETQQRIFFPVAGDGPDTIALKEKLRENVIESLKIGAGDAAPNIPAIVDETIRAGIEQRVASGAAPQDTIKWLIAIGRPPTADEIDRIFANAGNPDPRVLPPQGNGALAEGARALGVGARGVVQGAGDIANLISSPFIQGVNAVTGSNHNPDMGDTLADLLGLPEPQNDHERAAYQVNRFGTGALNAAGIARQGARYAGGALQQGLQRFGSSPGIDAAAGSAAGAGSEAARQMGGGPVAQAGGALVGGAAAVPVAARVASSRLVSALSGNPDIPPPAVVRAGQQEGVTVNRAMVDPDAQQRVTAIGKTMVGGRKMQSDMRDIGGQIEGRTQALGQGGDVLDAPVAGQTVENAAERYIKTSGKRLGKIYDGLERQVGDVKVPPKNSLAVVDESIARLSELGNTNSAELAYLKGLREDLGKDLSVASLRRLRTTLRQKIAKGELTFGEDEARILSIMDSASDDIASGLRNAGKAGAAAAFRRVDMEYRQRMDFIQNTVQKVVGRRNAHYHPEKIIANLKAMTLPKGDGAAFNRMFREMAPEEQRDIAATFVDALGKNADGNFSTALLVKHINRIPEGVRRTVFGEDGARSMANLELLAKEHKRVTHALGGSPTGVGNDYRSIFLNALFGGGTFLAGGTNLASAATGAAVAAAGVGAKSGRDYMNARLLMSPDIQKWLRSAPKTTSPKAINAHFDRLSAIAVRQPAIATDIERLQQMIMRAANENAVARSAASSGQHPDQEQ